MEELGGGDGLCWYESEGWGGKGEIVEGEEEYGSDGGVSNGGREGIKEAYGDWGREVVGYEVGEESGREGLIGIEGIGG